MESTIIIEFIMKYFYWAFLGWILMTIMQRRHGNRGAKKRMAVLYQAIIIFLIMVYANVLKMNELTDIYLIIAAIAVSLILFFGRKKILPYQTRCRECGKRISFEHVLYYDDPLCKDCYNEIIETTEKPVETHGDAP